jgi:Plavaka transposase
MTTPEVVKCPDGHFRRAVYGLRPYIADYPEQVWLSAIVQGWCPKYVPILLLVLLSITANLSDVMDIQMTLMLKILGGVHNKRLNF